MIPFLVMNNQINKGLTIPRLVGLTLFGVLILIIVTNFTGCAHRPPPVNRGTLPTKEVQKYRALGERYQYEMTRTVVINNGAKTWEVVLTGKCLKPDESLPSRPFRAVDNDQVRGFDFYDFTDGEPSSVAERQLMVAQAHRAARMTFKKGKMVSSQKL